MVEPVGRDCVTIEAGNRSNIIAEKIEGLIADGHLQPGDKVPSERQLCSRYNISRACVREAINALRGRGMIETIHGRGSYVCSLVDEVVDQSPLTRLYHAHPDMIYDLLDVRELLEGQAALLAAERGTEKDMYLIKKAYENMNTAPKNYDELGDVAIRDHGFHRAIYEASHNPILIHTLQSLMQLMRSSVETSIKSFYSRTQQKQIIDEDHQAIFIRIMERDASGAQKAAMNHVRNCRAMLLQFDREKEKEGRVAEWQ